MTATTYTIYIVNQSGTSQAFWCFQAPPQELAADPGDSRNSGAVRAVSLNDQGNADVEIPVQDIDEEEGGQDAGIVSDVSCNASSDVSYLTIHLTGECSPESVPLTYYICTGHDITAASDGRDALAGRNEQSGNFIAITIPDSFQNQSCTVRYDAPGRWSEAPGELTR